MQQDISNPNAHRSLEELSVVRKWIESKITATLRGANISSEAGALKARGSLQKRIRDALNLAEREIEGNVVRSDTLENSIPLEESLVRMVFAIRNELERELKQEELAEIFKERMEKETREVREEIQKELDRFIKNIHEHSKSVEKELGLIQEKALLAALEALNKKINVLEEQLYVLVEVRIESATRVTECYAKVHSILKNPSLQSLIPKIPSTIAVVCKPGDLDASKVSKTQNDLTKC